MSVPTAGTVPIPSFLLGWGRTIPFVLRKNRQGFSHECGQGQKGGLVPSWAEKMTFTLLFETSPISEATTRSQALLSFNPTESLQKQVHLTFLPVAHAGE